jgi:hypothetical protein
MQFSDVGVAFVGSIYCGSTKFGGLFDGPKGAQKRTVSGGYYCAALRLLSTTEPQCRALSSMLQNAGHGMDVAHSLWKNIFKFLQRWAPGNGLLCACL